MGTEYPRNKERREIVLNEMYDQEKISKDEFDAAMKESATMTFVGWQASDKIYSQIALVQLCGIALRQHRTISLDDAVKSTYVNQVPRKRLKTGHRVPKKGDIPMKQIILTGDRPTGRLHVGHYVGSLSERVRLQNSGEFDEIYIMIADAQALTDNAEHPEKVRQNIMEVALDYLACGLDPEKVNIFIQSMVPELTELTFYYMNLVTVSRVQRNPTVKSEIQMRGFESSIPVGFFCYPISQAADITAFRATCVPVGEDQMPMIEQCREIVHSFNRIYGETLTDPKIMLPSNSACLRLPGTDGKAKMSKSLGNCIYLADDEKTVRTKIMSMFTDPDHIRIEDPGKLEGNTVFTYLDAFCTDEHFAEFLPEYSNLDELKAHYTRGGLGDVKVKKFLNNVMQSILGPMRERRAYWEARKPEVYEILKKGSEVAERKAAETLADVRAAMKINYFDDGNLMK